MNNFKSFEDFNRVNLFKKRFIEKDYLGACNIVLSGWGTTESPLGKDEQKLIDKFMNSRTEIEREQYDNAMRSATGIFG